MPQFSDYERGQRDLLNKLLAPNVEIDRKLAAFADKEPDPHGRIPFDACFWITEVATQLGIKPLDELDRQEGDF
jgi:hypothetical protein